MSKEEFPGGVKIPSLFEMDDLPLSTQAVEEPASPYALTYSWGGSGGEGEGDSGGGSGESGGGESGGGEGGGGAGGGEGDSGESA